MHVCLSVCFSLQYGFEKVRVRKAISPSNHTHPGTTKDGRAVSCVLLCRCNKVDCMLAVVRPTGRIATSFLSRQPLPLRVAFRTKMASSTDAAAAASSSISRPVVLCGPSGVGKSTLIKKLFADMPNTFGFSVSRACIVPAIAIRCKTKPSSPST